MIKVLGLADIMAGLVFLGGALRIDLPFPMVLFFALYLIVKGAVFVLNSLDIGSLADVAAGIALLGTVFFQIPPILSVPLAVFLFGKGFLSIFAP